MPNSQYYKLNGVSISFKFSITVVYYQPQGGILPTIQWCITNHKVVYYQRCSGVPVTKSFNSSYTASHRDNSHTVIYLQKLYYEKSEEILKHLKVLSKYQMQSTLCRKVKYMY